MPPEDRSHLLISAHEGLAVVREKGRFSIGAFHQIKDLGGFRTAGYKRTEKYKVAGRKARDLQLSIRGIL